ncbi:hypothetical protein CJ195_26185 [Bacillus sp. UMB0899]|nr:hypothetical protein CJ195_26185 [Bacillus sp. UMB0899]
MNWKGDHIVTGRIEQRKQKKIRHIRVNIFFIVVFSLFVALIIRLGFFQIVYGEEYKKEVKKTVDMVVNTSVPRGKILDRNKRVILVMLRSLIRRLHSQLPFLI